MPESIVEYWERLHKAGGLSQIIGGGSPMGSAANNRPRWTEPKWVGQVPGLPGRPPPSSPRYVIDPAVEKLLTKKPPEWSVDRFFAKNIMTAEDVVKGLGLEPTHEQILERFVHQEMLHADNIGELKKSLFSKLLHEGYPPQLRTEVVKRSAQLWLDLQKSQGLICTVDELHKAKFETTGGAYHRRVTKTDEKTGKRKHAYYYDEKKYARDHGEHTSGEDNRKTYLSKTTLEKICGAGEKGCKIDEFKDLVEKFGSKPVYEAMKEHRDGKKIRYKGGMFTSSEKPKPSKKKIEKSEAVAFVIDLEKA